MPSSQPPKKPATMPIDRCEEAGDERGRGADQQRVASAVEQPRGDVAALVVGAEEVVGRIPGRPDRRRRRGPSPVVLGGITGTRLPVHDRRPVEVRLERIGVRDVVRVERRREAREDDERRARRASPSRSGCGAGAGAPAPRGSRRRERSLSLGDEDPVGRSRRSRRRAQRGRSRGSAPAVRAYCTHDWSTSQ